MKKILLIGELSEIVRSLNECLMGEFQIQLCAPQLDNVQGMTKIIKPDLVIFCEIGIEEVDTQILTWMQEKNSKMPVIIITTSEEWRKYESFLEDHQFDKLFRPVTKTEIIEKCNRMLHLGGMEDVYDFSQERKKILVVDDSPLMLRNLKNILDETYKVFLATSGQQALKMIPQKEPDLILLDYEMPGMDGRATFEAILEDDYAKDIPVVFLTSIADRKQIYAVLKSYPAGYILKPPDKDRLLSTIREVFYGK